MSNSLSEQFLNTLASGKAMHGYLITASDTDRASDLARRGAAQLLFGTDNTVALKLHPDYFELDGSIKIDELRTVRTELYKQTYAGKNRAVIICNVHLMNDNAINAMLKMLEEPPDGTYFLLTGIEQRILPTIRSRCHIIRIGTEPVDEVYAALRKNGASELDAWKYARMGCGNEKCANRLYADEGFRELRSSAINALFDAINKKMPFKWAKAVGKDRSNALHSIEFMLSICHDASLILVGLGIETNVDFALDIEKHFRGFTNLKLGCIIDVLVDTAMRLTTNASVNLMLDGMIVRLMQV